MLADNFTPISVKDKNFENLYVSRVRQPFNDARSFKVWKKLVKQMADQRSAIIQRVAKNQKEADQFYHFFNNKRVKVEELIKMNCEIRTDSIRGNPTYIIGDTSSFNMDGKGRIKDIEKAGVLTGGRVAGFHTHVNLAMNDRGEVLGLSDIIFWSRSPKTKEKEKAAKRKRRWEDKESVRWAMGAENSKKVLESASSRTYIFDREADDFELQDYIVNQLQDHFIIRAKHDRSIEWQGSQMKVSECMEQSKKLGSYEIDLRSLNHFSRTYGKQIKRKARKSTVEVRCEKVVLLSPEKRTKKGRLPLYLVEAREVGVSEEENPILWRLWTTHPVKNLEEAIKIIDLYSKRWTIEQFFRTLKQKGLQIEETQLGTVDAILKQTTLAMNTAIKIMQLVYARDLADSQPIGDVFTENEQKVLRKVKEKLEGKTEKQKNPYSPENLSWASWIIGRLGGWKGYSSQKPPGPITMLRGLLKFGAYMEAYELLSDTT